MGVRPGVATLTFKMAESGSRGRRWRHRSDAVRSCTACRRRWRPRPCVMALSRRLVCQVSHATRLSPASLIPRRRRCSCLSSKSGCFLLLSFISNLIRRYLTKYRSNLLVRRAVAWDILRHDCRLSSVSIVCTRPLNGPKNRGPARTVDFFLARRGPFSLKIVQARPVLGPPKFKPGPARPCSEDRRNCAPRYLLRY